MAEFTSDDRVVLVSTTDAHTTLKPGDQGTVTVVDDLATVHIRWDNGSTLGMSTRDGDVIALLPAAVEAHAVHIDPDGVEGAAILDLHDRVKQLEPDDSDNGWNGGDVVTLVEDFFLALGIDFTLPAATVREQLRRRPRTYTVLGLRIGGAGGEVMIAGVVRGTVLGTDTASCADEAQRVHVQVRAVDARHAEAVARARFAASTS